MTLTATTSRRISETQSKASLPIALNQRHCETGEPILVTRFGKPVATIMPPGIAHHVPRFGTGIGPAEILGDIVGSISDESDWEAAQDPESDK